MDILRALLAAVLALLWGALAACSGTVPAPDTTPPFPETSAPAAYGPTADGPLTPADTRLDLAAVTAPSSQAFALTIVQGEQRQPFGTLTQTLARTPDGGLVRVQRLTSPRGSQVDSLTFAADLTPRAHYSLNPGRTVDLRYTPHAVTGMYTNTGAQPVVIEDARRGPSFDSGLIDLVARALPLDLGFEADVQTYERASADATDTDVLYAVRVTGLEAVDGRPAAVVTFSKGEGTSTRLWVDAETREVVRQEAEVAPGVTFLMEPQ